MPTKRSCRSLFAKSSFARRLRAEQLEDRRMLAGVTVGNALDVVDGDTTSIASLIATPGADGVSLREAVVASNNTPGLDRISFDPAVFTGGAASVIRLGGTELTITDSLTIDGDPSNGSTPVVISGDAMGNDTLVPDAFITDVSASLANSATSLDDNSRVINFAASSTTASDDLTLNNVTITGGRTPVNSLDGGGGIMTVAGNVTLVSSNVSGNSTTGEAAIGGGIRTIEGAVMLTDSTVSGNSTTGEDANGGGIATVGGTVTLMRSTVSENSTLNSMSEGGGIGTISGAVALTESTVSGNRTQGNASDGGGIFTVNGTVTLTNSTLSGNSTAGGAAEGGGLFTILSNVTLDSSTVTENASSAAGGGIYVYDTGSNPLLTIQNSIVAGNSSSGVAPDLRPDPNSTLDIDFSLIGNTTGSGVMATTGTGNILGQAAALGSLADNGGPTQTHALLPTSPAIDAGNTTLAKDQRGENRPIDNPLVADATGSDGSDIGAFELPAPNTAPTITNEGGAEQIMLSQSEGLVSVINVDATDDVDSEGSGLVYSLSGTDADDFVIDGATGMVDFLSAPDYENPADADTNNQYEFTVTVTDSGGLTDALDVQVNVGNEVTSLLLTIDATSISENGGTATGTLSRFGDMVGDVTVMLTSSDTTEATVPASVSFTGYDVQETFTIAAVDDFIRDGNQTITISAEIVGETSTGVELTVIDDGDLNTPPMITGLPSDVVVVENTTSPFDLSSVVLSDVDNQVLTATLSASAGGFVLADGSANNVTVMLDNPTTFSLVGLGGDINAYLDTISNIQYTAGARGDNAALFQVFVGDSIEPDSVSDVGNIDVVEAPSLVVTTTADDVNAFDGQTSLREAINLANTNPGADTITFDTTLFGTAQTIALGSQLPTITDALTVTGPGASLLTVDAGNGGDNAFGTGRRLSTLSVRRRRQSNGNHRHAQRHDTHRWRRVSRRQRYGIANGRHQRRKRRIGRSDFQCRESNLGRPHNFWKLRRFRWHRRRWRKQR